MKSRRIYLFLLLILPVFFLTDCAKSNPVPVVTPPVIVIPPVITAPNEVDFWLTKGDQSVLLQKQTDVLSFGTAANSNVFINVDTTQVMQTIDGFGFTLTGGSATLINAMNSTAKADLLQELFGNGANSIGISYLRISIGASDLSAAPFTYDDLPAGQTDLLLNNFSLAAEKADLIPALKAILAINPAIKILGSPWSPPVWMKDNNSFIGGSLQPQYYSVYAQYFVKYIQQMKAEGITIDAITTQNEPLYGGNNPSMLMSAVQQAEFIKTNLGPAFQSNGIDTKIILYDHNCDRTDYPIAVLNDAAANPYVNGSAFHLYGGVISALSIVHDAFPDKQVYFTEQYTASTGDFSGDLKWHVKNVIIGSMRNWSRNALEWNLANDGSYGPHTNGGCTTCKGALTIGSSVTRNVAYYIVAHASKFVPAGSVRIGSNVFSDLQTAAFKTPAGDKVLIVENDAANGVVFNIKCNNKWVTTALPAGGVGTYTWH
ncbi:MAG: glycoside hydrolase family 30 beta sandwich domain-containing protein [Ferruginibacter sp.]